MNKNNNITVVYDKDLSSLGNPRYVVINSSTGEVLDNAQGYGYKTKRNAYAAWAYKHPSSSKPKFDIVRKKVQKWIDEHYDFAEALREIRFEILKGSWGEKAKFNAKFVKHVLEENNYTSLCFTPDDLIRVL